MSGYWRASGSEDQPRKGDRASAEPTGEGRRERGRGAEESPDARSRAFDELSIEEQADSLRGPALPEDLCLDVAREWKDRIDLELQLGELAELPAFGPVLQGLEPPLIAHETIYRPGMDADDPAGRETAEAWTELGYSLQVKGYRPLYAENLAYLLRVQLTSARIESTEETQEGVIYQVRTGLVGENGRHAILVSRWLVRTDQQRPQLLRAWPEPLPELPSGDER